MSQRRHIQMGSSAVLASAVFLLGGCVSDVPKQVDVFCWAEEEGLILPDDKWDSKWEPESDVICTPISGKAAAATGGDGAQPPTDPSDPATPPTTGPGNNVYAFAGQSGTGAGISGPGYTANSTAGGGNTSASADGYTVTVVGGVISIDTPD